MKRAALHLSFERMAASASGELLEQGEQAHLDSCAACRGGLGELTQLLQDLAAGAPELPSAEATQRCVALFAAAHPPRAPFLERLACWVSPQPVLAGAVSGLRGPSAVAERRLYEVDGITVDLELSLTGEAVHVTGLVVRDPGESRALLAWAEQNGRILTETTVAAGGLFQLVLPCSPPADIVLEFENSRVRLHLGP